MEVKNGTGKAIFVVHFHACWREGRERETGRKRVAGTIIAICVVLFALDIEDNRQTALFYAARQGHVHTCNFLVCSRSDINTIDKFGETAWLGVRVQIEWQHSFLFHCLRLASDFFGVVCLFEVVLRGEAVQSSGCGDAARPWSRLRGLFNH